MAQLRNVATADQADASRLVHCRRLPLRVPSTAPRRIRPPSKPARRPAGPGRWSLAAQPGPAGFGEPGRGRKTNRIHSVRDRGASAPSGRRTRHVRSRSASGRSPAGWWGCVADHRLRDEGHSETMLRPPVAELPVLRDAQPRVEAPEHPEAIGRQGEVVGREEARPARQAVAPVRVGELQDQSATLAYGFVADIATVLPPSASPGKAAWRVASARSQPGSGSVSSSVNATSSPAAPAAPWLRAADFPQTAARECGAGDGHRTGGHLVEPRASTVLDDDHLEALTRIVLRGEALEAGGQARRTVPGRDHHRTGWRCVPDCLARRSRARA